MIRLPHLETNVTAACQNRCIACNHFVPLQVAQFKASMIKPEQMEQDLRIFSRFVHVEAYGMLGGEPTLHPQLPRLIDIAIQSRIADIVEVWTNGQSLPLQSERFWRILHKQRLVVTLYPGKHDAASIRWIENKALAFEVQLRFNDERTHPNFTQLLEKNDTDPIATQQKYNACWFKTFSRVLDNGHFYRCCTSPYIPKLLQGRPEGSDGLCVNESLTERDIIQFLDQPRAMQSCTICAGRNTPSAFPIPWSEIKDPAAWLKASSGRP